MRIADYIGEGTQYDKKETLEMRRPLSWLKSVCAFANGVGGALLFGVANDDTLVGLADAKGDSEKISEAIQARLQPLPKTNLRLHEEDGKQFIILRVESGRETPYWHVGDGRMQSFIRVGNESVPADPMALRNLALMGSREHYDSLLSSNKMEDFSFTRLRSAYRTRTGSEFEESDFISFGLANKDGMLTNGGVLLADNPPPRLSRMFCTRWQGLDKASDIMDATDGCEFDGDLLRLLDEGCAFVRKNAKTRWKKTGDGRVELPDYPEDAVLEAIVNALIHRDYLLTGTEIHIDIFDDRLEIYSPGGMYDGSRVQDLDPDKIPSHRRNPIIADVFGRIHYMERRGSGFHKIRASYHRAPSFRAEREPRFDSTDKAFYVTLFNLNYNIPLGEEMPSSAKLVSHAALDQKGMVDHAEQTAFELRLAEAFGNVRTRNKARILFDSYGFVGVFGRSEVMRMFGIGSSSAGNLLSKLKEQRFIEPVSGQGKGRYRFVARQA